MQHKSWVSSDQKEIIYATFSLYNLTKSLFQKGLGLAKSDTKDSKRVTELYYTASSVAKVTVCSADFLLCCCSNGTYFRDGERQYATKFTQPKWHFLINNNRLD